ncbi:MAG: hypothetical protein QXI19_12985 [Candidatus Caldarchaeum sp.]
MFPDFFGEYTYPVLDIAQLIIRRYESCAEIAIDDIDVLPYGLTVIVEEFVFCDGQDSFVSAVVVDIGDTPDMGIRFCAVIGTEFFGRVDTVLTADIRMFEGNVVEQSMDITCFCRGGSAAAGTDEFVYGVVVNGRMGDIGEWCIFEEAVIAVDDGFVVCGKYQMHGVWYLLSFLRSGGTWESRDFLSFSRGLPLSHSPHVLTGTVFTGTVFTGPVLKLKKKENPGFPIRGEIK